MKPSTRSARPADVEAIAAIESAWPTAAGWTKAQFAEELGNPAARVIVIEESGAVAAYAIFRAVAEEAQILDVAVAPARTRRGLGRLLVEDALARAAAAGLKKATLEVRADNAGALALYRAAGFSVVGRRPNFYNGVCDAVLMDRDLV